MCFFQAACAVILLLLGAAQACAGCQPDLLVKLAPESDAGYLGNGIFEAVAQVQSKSQPSFPGTTARFRVLLLNVGDQPDSFRLTGTAAQPGAQVSFQDQAGNDRSAEFSSGLTTPVLAPGESLSYLVQVAPAAFQPGASFRVTVGAVSLADLARVDQVKTETVACGNAAAVIISAPPDGFGAPGTQVSYPYTVTNVGSTADSFALSVAGPAGWSAALFADDGSGGGVAGDGVRQAGETAATAATGTLAPGASYRFFVTVTVPAAGGDGARGETTLSAVGAGASAADRVTTSAVAPTISVVESVRNLTRGGIFSGSTEAFPGDTLEYRMAVTNSGSTSAVQLGVRSPLPASTLLFPGSLRISTSAAGDGGACAAAVCGFARETGGSIVASLGTGAAENAGGSLAPGSTLYVFFQVRVE